MKNKAFLLFIIFSTIAFSNENTTDNSKSIMNISATVIKPLTVSSNGDLNFGTLLPGASVPGFSSFSIEGEPNSRVDISFSGVDRVGNYSYYSDLKSLTTEDTLLLSFNCSPVGEGYLSTNPSITLDSTGKYILNVSANIQSLATQTPAKYSGQIKIRAIYE
ncbi:DUF4402 domain-containing protein [uncultured Cetobacterium sp.]|uniref:DUF4402 domain-containing protein n=1 Tax=uncultured Cetobacterium sp. TaxID=527638 RepID=UPI00261B990D|nr:DUF4402 domain-containing protein [uncultured Cetobacterium sp.]